MEPVTGVALLIQTIGEFITNSITWVGQVLTFALAQPIILFFMAVGLAGVMYRWARKIIHF